MPDPLIPTPVRARLGGLAIAVATLVLLIATEPRLAIVWDEGYTLWREARVRSWFQAMADPAGTAARWEATESDREWAQPDDPRHVVPRPTRDQINTRQKLLDPQVIAWFWPFSREEPHGHPPFYAIVGMAGDLAAPGWSTIPRARLGPMLAFSMTAGAIFTFLLRRYGIWSAAAGAGAWVFQPQLFGQGHYATYDSLITCLWVASILAFGRAVEPDKRLSALIGGAILFGLLAGWAADTKLTGWFLPLPFLVWTALYRDRRGAMVLAIGGVVAVLTLYAFNPVLWFDPIHGLIRFWRSNLSRAVSIPIATQFLGTIYMTPRQSLPWYNTLAWTLFVTPPGLLSLALLGTARALRWARVEPFGVLVLGHWLFLLALRALPHAPGHDGIRQFLPAFGVLAILVGLGAAWVVLAWRSWGKWLVGGSLAGAAISTAWIMPVPLSYFSPVIGGLKGATSLGMEPTYYWDALTDDALTWINKNTPQNRTVMFATNPASWFYLRKEKRLEARLYPFETGMPLWYVVQNRPGAMSPLDRDLIAHAKRRHILSEKAGVPLVWAFPIQEVESRLGSVRLPGGASP